MPLKTAQYDQDFLKANMMGPNAILILEELLDHLSLSSRMRILDLGCGKGLSSIFLAREYKARIFALDLWIPATDNHIRFQKTGLDDFIVPIHADAHELPFANHFFDAVISVDSYHYFGNNDTFFSEKIRPLLKKGGLVALAFPGLKSELQTVPEAMKPYWKEEELPMRIPQPGGRNFSKTSCTSCTYGKWPASKKPGKAGLIRTIPMPCRTEPCSGQTTIAS